jgi:hypothetical protein
MTPAPKNSRRASKRVGLAQTGIPDYANKSLDEQVALLSKLFMENSRRPIYEVWSKLDSISRTVILAKLGCLLDKDSRVTRAKRIERDRELVAELKKHLRRLRRFVRTQVEHEYQTIHRLRFRNPHFHFSLSEGRCTLKDLLASEIMHLNQVAISMTRGLKPRSKWDVRNMVLCQEYVRRRATFLGIPDPVQLSPSAIADIYQLSKRIDNDNDNSDTAENIRKAIERYKKDPRNIHLIQNMGIYLKDW